MPALRVNLESELTLTHGPASLAPDMRSRARLGSANAWHIAGAAAALWLGGAAAALPVSLAQPPAVPAALPLGADGGDIFLSFRNIAGSDTTRFAKTFDPASFTGPSPALLAATILYTATDVADLVPGQDLWEYRYVVSGLTLTAGQGFTIFFAPNLYTLLETPPPFVNADWDALTVQPDVLLNSAGYYDALALRTNPSFIDPFKLRFVWLGTGTPGAQPFTVYDTDFSTISQGQTTTIPEPSGLALLLVAALFQGAALCNRRPKNPPRPAR